MQNHVVHIYSRSPVDEGSVLDILEFIKSGQEETFHSLNDLQSKLSHSIGKDQPGFPDLALLELGH